VISTKTS